MAAGAGRRAVPRVNAVCLDDGTVRTGAGALQAAAAHPDRFEAQPLRRLSEGDILLGGRKVAVVDLVAATLRDVAAAATQVAGGPPGSVVLTVPAGWGPRRRTLLRQAAHRAGLADARLVETPVAVASRVVATGTRVAVGAWIGVCDLGAGVEASVVRRTPAGWEVLATVGADAGGRRLDALLAEQLLRTVGAEAPDPVAVLPPGERAQVLASVATAREALTSVSGVAVAMPAPYPAVVLTTAQVQQVIAPLLAQAASCWQSAIDAAEVGPEQCAALLVVGGLAATPGVAARLAPAVVAGAQPWPAATVPEGPQTVAVLGAVDAGSGGEDGEVGADVAPPPVPTVARALGPLVPGFTSLGLWSHFLLAGQRYTTPGTNVYDYVLAPWAELAVAGVLAVVTCLSCATLLAGALPPPVTTRPVPAGVAAARRLAAGLVAAVGLGVSITCVYALVGATTYALDSGQFLRWALRPSLPVLAAATVAAALAWRARRHPPGGWHAWVTFPPTPSVVVGVGTLSVAGALYAPFWSSHLGNQVALHGGAAVMGVGMAMAVATHTRVRIMLGVPLAAIAAALVDSRMFGLLAVAVAIAITGWWGRRIWQLSAAGALRPLPQVLRR